MTKDRFTEILKEYKLTDEQIEALWRQRPSDDIDESLLRETAKEKARFWTDQGRTYQEILPGVLLHRRDLKDPNDTDI